MFLPLVADQLRRLKPTSGNRKKLASPVTGSAGVSPLAPITVDVPMGTRYQLFRALRAMAAGQFMLVEHRIPALLDHSANAPRRTELFQSLRNISSWQGQSDIEPVLVPGTAYACVIGRILIRSGWCAPIDRPHWVPSLRFFSLTDLGRESFSKAQIWWSELTTLERMQMMVLE